MKSQIEKHKKYCNGCFNYISRYQGDLLVEVCGSFVYKNIKNCPCINCLVKMICDENCDKFDKFSKKNSKVIL